MCETLSKCITSKSKEEKSKSNFFNIKKELERMGLITNGKWYGKALAAILDKRRIGKSTSMINDLVIPNWEESNFENKLLFIKNTEEELKQFKASFNDRFKTEYYAKGSIIYKIYCDESGREISSKRKIIGLCGALSTFAKLKSLIINTNFNLVIWDEFNGLDTATEQENIKMLQSLNKNQYFALLELIASIEGDSKDLLVCLIGNKVNSQNDILLNLGFELPEADNPKTIISDLSINFEDSEFKIIIRNGGTEEYTELHKGELLSKALATFNARADRYFNKNDFFQRQAWDVISYRHITDTEILYYFATGDLFIEYGKFIYKGQECYYFKELNFLEDVKDISNFYSLDYSGYVSSIESQFLEDETAYDFAIDLLNLLKQKQLYFTSNFLKTIIIKWIRLTGGFLLR